MFSKLTSVVIVSFTLLTVACAVESEPAGEERDEVVTDLSQTEEAEITPQAINTGAGPRQSGTARCYDLDCPDDQQETCFIPCMKQRGQTVAGCSRACSCTAKPIDCSPKIAL